MKQQQMCHVCIQKQQVPNCVYLQGESRGRRGREIQIYRERDRNKVYVSPRDRETDRYSET